MMQPLSHARRACSRLEDRAELPSSSPATRSRSMTVTSRRSRELFTPDGAFRSRDGVMEARGTQAAAGAVPRPLPRRSRSPITSRTTTSSTFGADPDRPRACITAHAEVWRNGRALIGALRYQDSYRREQGAGASRTGCCSFLYYLPVEEYASASATRLRHARLR